MAVPPNIREAALGFLEEVFADMTKSAAPTLKSLRERKARELGVSAIAQIEAPIPAVVSFPTSS